MTLSQLKGTLTSVLRVWGAPRFVALQSAGRYYCHLEALGYVKDVFVCSAGGVPEYQTANLKIEENLAATSGQSAGTLLSTPPRAPAMLTAAGSNSSAAVGSSTRLHELGKLALSPIRSRSAHCTRSVKNFIFHYLLQKLGSLGDGSSRDAASCSRNRIPVPVRDPISLYWPYLISFHS